jgi:hypothetical protein
MEEKPNPLKELFDELFTLLENLETQNLAVLLFLKDQKAGTDKKLAPYLERAGSASSVKWRAARVRMEYLLSPIEKEAKDQEKEKAQEQEKAKAQEQDKAKTQEQDKNSATDKGKKTDTDQNQAQEIRKGPNQDSRSVNPEQSKPSSQAEKADTKKAPDAGTARGQSKSEDNQKRR